MKNIQKFRAWDKEEKKMLYWEELVDDYRGEYASLWGQDHLIIMQYLGKKDKNGKEIYEKDFIKYKCMSAPIGRFPKKTGENVMLIHDLEEAFDQDGNGRFINEDCEIVGSFFKNKEFLEKIK